MERSSDDLHWLAGMNMGRLRRLFVARRKNLKVALAALAVVLLTGQLSNEVSIRHCLQATRGSTASTSQDLLRRVSRDKGDVWPRGREIAWLSRDDLRDEAPDLLGFRAWWYPPLLVPSFESGVYYPWAYAIPLRWPTPFVVRVAYGFAVDGQSGGTGIDYYLAFFGCAARIHRRSLIMF